MATFDRFLVELKAYAPNAEIRETYDTVDATWQRVKALAVGSAPSRDHAAKLLALDAQLLQAAQLGTLQFQQASGRHARGEHRDREVARRVHGGHDHAHNAQAGIAGQKQSLEGAQNQWVFFAVALDASNGTPNASAQSRLARASELILTAFDGVTLTFERAS